MGISHVCKNELLYSHGSYFTLFPWQYYFKSITFLIHIWSELSLIKAPRLKADMQLSLSNLKSPKYNVGCIDYFEDRSLYM